MQSCIYEGRVRHTRTTPVEHHFDYRLFMMYLDLDELPTLFQKRWFWSTTRPALARFHRGDHLGDNDKPLSDCVRDLVATETGYRPEGPIRLLTNLTYFGYGFNPVSFYYCFAADGRTVDFIVAEVNNTPWGEQDCYVLSCNEDSRRGAAWRFRPHKKMHVSPFMPMEVDYEWALAEPGERLSVYMVNARDGARVFDAALLLRRTDVSAWSLASALIRYPMQTVKIIVSIYWQALRLWLKRCPLYPHPDKTHHVSAKRT